MRVPGCAILDARARVPSVASTRVSPLAGFYYRLEPFSHRSPFTAFRASAVGYVVTSLRDFKQNKFSPQPIILPPCLMLRFGYNPLSIMGTAWDVNW